YRLRRRFPSFWRSFWLGLGAPVRLPLRNPTFIVMMGLLQGLLLFAREREPRVASVGVLTMTVVFFALALFFAAGLSARRPWIRIFLLSVLHTWAQLTVGRIALPVFDRFPGVDLARVWARPSGMQAHSWDMVNTITRVGHDVLRYVAYSAVAGLLSAVVVALYLIVASLFGLNFNELFSSQRIEGFKALLRMHIANDGSLTIYSVGLRRVRWIGPSFVRWHWKADPKGAPNSPWFRPRRRLRPHLIETVRIPSTRPAYAPSQDGLLPYPGEIGLEHHDPGHTST
ncbi:MAG: hypothetical protein ACM3JP_00490, partial [Betaproteobacteria bacterium]